MRFKVFRFKKVKSTNNTAIRIIRKTNYDVKLTEDGKLDLYTHKTETKEL